MFLWDFNLFLLLRYGRQPRVFSEKKGAFTVTSCTLLFLR